MNVMSVPKMKIVLSENFVPFRTSIARQIPLRFQGAADKAVGDFVKSKSMQNGYGLFEDLLVRKTACASISICCRHC